MKRADAYRTIRERFQLKARQRDLLDGSSAFEPIMEAALRQDWDRVRELLISFGIMPIDQFPPAPTTAITVAFDADQQLALLALITQALETSTGTWAWAYVNVLPAPIGLAVKQNLNQFATLEESAS